MPSLLFLLFTTAIHWWNYSMTLDSYVGLFLFNAQTAMTIYYIIHVPQWNSVKKEKRVGSNTSMLSKTSCYIIIKVIYNFIQHIFLFSDRANSSLLLFHRRCLERNECLRRSVWLRTMVNSNWVWMPCEFLDFIWISLCLVCIEGCILLWELICSSN